MSCIINIDTAEAAAHVTVAKEGVVLHALQQATQKDHAAFVQTAVQELLARTSLSFNDIDAVAVTAGPGSYTGLRVGMASAKGLCFALDKPLITLNTLEVLTKAVLLGQPGIAAETLYCPMMDARRMEVFTAIYDQELTALLPPMALVLDENAYAEYLSRYKILFFGTGSAKWQAACKNTNASFTTISNSAAAMAALSFMYWQQKNFANLAYVTPFYIKEFKTNT